MKSSTSSNLAFAEPDTASATGGPTEATVPSRDVASALRQCIIAYAIARGYSLIDMLVDARSAVFLRRQFATQQLLHDDRSLRRWLSGEPAPPHVAAYALRTAERLARGDLPHHVFSRAD